MHLLEAMSRRSHRSLRLAALALLAVAAIWPRARAGSLAAELSKGGAAHASTQGVAARSESTAHTAAAKLVSSPRTAKLGVTTADGLAVNN